MPRSSVIFVPAQGAIDPLKYIFFQIFFLNHLDLNKTNIGELEKKILIYYFGSLINDQSLGGSQDVPDILRTTIKCFSIFHQEHNFFLTQNHSLKCSPT